MKRIAVPSRRWYENEERELLFPDRWQVDNLTSPGLDKPALTADEIRTRIEHPVAGPPLVDLATGKQQAVIVFDDMTRPTPTRDVVPHVLDALHRAGLSAQQIRFLWALGTHGTYDMINARKKLGDAVVEQYAVYNHDAFQNTVYVGRTPTGVELWFNRGFMECDLKIGIGCITAHLHVGFGGGAKLIMPGVAGIETVVQFHNQMYRDPSRTGLGHFDNNIMRAECDAAGDAVGLDFKVDCLINRRGEIASLYAGAFRTTHARGAEEATDHYGIPHATGYDIAILNTYGKANEAAIALLFAPLTLTAGTGTAVLIADAPEGQVPHYVWGPWGPRHGGRHYIPRPEGFARALANHLIVLTPQPDPSSLQWFCHVNDATVVKTWPEVLRILDREYPGAARVGVVQDGTMQYMKRPGG